MTHPTDLELSMFADDALLGDESRVVAAHLDACAACRERVGDAEAELQLIAAALRSEEAAIPPIPEFKRPASLRSFALANVATAMVIWLGQFLWKTLFGELVMDLAARITSGYLPGVYEVASATALYLLKEGTAMIDTYFSFVVLGVLVLTALALVLMYRRHRDAGCMCLLALSAVTMLAPTPASALDIRRDEDIVTIAESETIYDTLIVAAETVLIEGTVTGDLVAVGRRVEISGAVGGNLVSFADSVKVRGKVGGLVLGAADSYELSAASVAGDLWAAGDSVRVDEYSSIGRNAAIAAETASMAGKVSKDLYAFAQTAELSGEVSGNLEAFVEQLRLLNGASVGGDVRYRSESEDRLYRAGDVRVGGKVEFLSLPESLERKNRYATLEFYLWQIARFVAAFIVGVVLLWLVPALRSLTIGAGMDGLKTAGVGFLALVSVPITAVLIAFTLVGLPLSLITIVTWLTALYLANIVVAAVVGRMLLGEKDGLAVSLLAGLAVVIVAINLPFIGGIIGVVLKIVGLGLITQHLMRVVSRRESNPLGA